jgi:hypothetical protein
MKDLPHIGSNPNHWYTSLTWLINKTINVLIIVKILEYLNWVARPFFINLFWQSLLIISCGYGIHSMEICLKVGNVYWLFDDQLIGNQCEYDFTYMNIKHSYLWTEKGYYKYHKQQAK